MWKKVVEEAESRNDRHMPGCILAHHMGLGKTLSTIVFLLRFFKEKKGRRAMVVCPPTLIANWVREFDKWAKSIFDTRNLVHVLNSGAPCALRAGGHLTRLLQASMRGRASPCCGAGRPAAACCSWGTRCSCSWSPRLRR